MVTFADHSNVLWRAMAMDPWHWINNSKSGKPAISGGDIIDIHGSAIE